MKEGINMYFDLIHIGRDKTSRQRCNEEQRAAHLANNVELSDPQLVGVYGGLNPYSARVIAALNKASVTVERMEQILATEQSLFSSNQ